MSTDNVRAAFEAVLDEKHTSTCGRQYDVSSPDGRDRFYAWWSAFSTAVAEKAGEIADENQRKVAAADYKQTAKFWPRDLVEIESGYGAGTVATVAGVGGGKCLIRLANRAEVWADDRTLMLFDKSNR